jgi:hypothetical protein
MVSPRWWWSSVTVELPLRNVNCLRLLGFVPLRPREHPMRGAPGAEPAAARAFLSVVGASVVGTNHGELTIPHDPFEGFCDE